MLYFKHFIIISIFISLKATVYPILKKYGKVKDTNGIVIFESKDFYEGDNMYFKIEKDGSCNSDLHYGYFSNSEEIGALSPTSYSVSSKSSSSSTSSNQRNVISSTNYFTIKKKSEEYKDSNGNFLLLKIDCYEDINDIDFENTKNEGLKTVKIIIIICIVLFVIAFGVMIGVYCYRRRKIAQMSQAYINQAPIMMYGGPQPMNPQQGNMVYMHGGQQVMVQPNGNPYNNSNIQYSNILNNTPSRLDAHNNAVPQQNSNMIPQSSEERGYISNNVNEKVIK
jgi:hypothetical protein